MGVVLVLFYAVRKFPDKYTVQFSSSPRYESTTRLYGGTSTFAVFCYTVIGRLGNNMFGYASAFSIAKSKEMKLVVRSGLKDYFLLPSESGDIETSWKEKCERLPLRTQPKHFCNRFDQELWKMNGSTSVNYYGCLRSWKYLAGHEHDIRKEFAFRPKVYQAAVAALRLALKQHDVQDGTLIGVHVRRGDRLSFPDFQVPPRQYFNKAMDFMRTKYGNVTFVICSDDKPWSTKYLNFSDSVFVLNEKPIVDMAVLTLCNHTIMSVGTFGWWSAWLANGTTVYYSKPFTAHRHEDLQTNMTEFMPYHWIPMS